jgi:hypothetical protein
LFGELDVDEVGLSGMVALMKMSESWLRYRVSMRDCGDCFSEDEYGEALTGVRDGCCVCVFDGKVVVSGESSWRFARGDVGRPVSERATMLKDFERGAIADFVFVGLPDLYIDDI